MRNIKMNKRATFTLLLVTSGLLIAGLFYLSSPCFLTPVSAAKSKNRKSPDPRGNKQSDAPTPQPPPLVAGQSATLLPDGRWLLVGGEDKEGPLDRASLTDSRTGARTPLAKTLQVARAGHTATLLPDGRVLILGGVDAKGRLIASVEVFDPETQTFAVVAGSTLSPRAYHTATVLTDGQLLIAGGLSTGKRPGDNLEVWDSQTNHTSKLALRLTVPRRGHSATLLADGNVLLWGGVGEDGKELTQGEMYVADERSVHWVGSRAEPDGDVAPFVAASYPKDGAIDVGTEVRLGMRFSHPLNVATVTREQFVLSGAEETVAARVVPAEAGRLVFITPTRPLKEGVTYTLSVSGAADASGLKLTPHTSTFTTAGKRAGGQHDTHDHMRMEDGAKPVGAPDSEEWIPDSDALKDGKSRQQIARQQPVEMLKAAKGVTALAGRVLTLEGEPLPNVTLQAGTSSTRTDATGRFLLSSLNAGQQVLIINGTTASQPNKPYAMFDTRVDVDPGQTNILPYTIWLPLVDVRNATDLAATATGDVVAKTPRVPGLEVHVPKGSVMRYPKGDLVRKLTITPIPANRPPFPLPAGQKEGLLFTMQTHGARIEEGGARGLGSAGRGLRILYPNHAGLAPGTVVDIWSYDANGKGWFVSGKARVGRDGKQIVPDKGRVQSSSVWCAIFIGWPGLAPNVGPPPGGARDGDPVDLNTGLFVYQKSDLVVSDTIPLGLDRTYRQNDTMDRAFGIGATHPLDMFLVGVHEEQVGNYADLILPDGARIRYDYAPGLPNGAWGEHLATTTAFHKSTLHKFPDYWLIETTEGTIYDFGWKSVGQPYSAEARTYLRSITDRYGNRVNFYRDDLFRLVKVVTPNNRWLEFTYSGTSPRITQAKDNIGRTTGYEYDTDGRLWKVTNAKGGVTEYTYDSQHRMLTIKDALGVTVLTNEYDVNGRVKKQTQADGTTYQFAYTLSTDPNTPHKVVQTEVTNPRGLVRRVVFNDAGLPLSEIYGVGRSDQWSFTYERQAVTQNVLSVTDSWGRKTAFTYDAAGNTTGVTHLAGTPNAVTSSVAYEPTFNQVTSVTDPLNHTTTFAYDDKGRLTTATNALNNQNTFTYNGAGRLHTTVNALNVTTATFTYESGNLVKVEGPFGRTMRQFVDAVGRTTRVTNSLGHTTRYQYDAFNRPVKAIDPQGAFSTMTHDALGNILSVTDPRGNTISYTYDNMGRVTSRTDQLQHTDAYQYDAYGNLSQVTDRKGQVTSFGYDVFNRPTLVTYADLTTTGYEYDEKGRLWKVNDSASGLITYAYDDFDRVTGETTPQGSVVYGYDAAGRLSSMQVTGQPVVAYGYDAADRLTSISQGGASVLFTYDAGGRRASLTLPNGVSTQYQYDDASQLVGLTYWRSGFALGNLTFEYDAAGRRTKVGGSYARQTLPQAMTAASYNAANQQTAFGGQSLAYDLNGNLTSDGANTYTWDARGQLASMSGTGTSASFQYDALGRRVGKTVNGQATGFMYDGSNIVQEQASGTPSANLLNGGVDEVFRRTDSAGAWTPLADALGSTLEMTDSTGTVQTSYTYDPFGNTTQSGGANANASQFTGRENDGTGLYFYRGRYYAPQLQRFISEDPIGLAGGDNQYAYVGNNPISFTDPFGLQADGPHNALRNPFSSDHWFLNGTSNTVSDLLLLDHFAEWAWIVGDHCRPMSERMWAAAKGVGTAVFLAAGGQIVGKVLGKLGGIIAQKIMMRAHAAQRIAVIGRLADTRALQGLKNADILTLPKNAWTIAKNDAWVQAAIDSRATAYMASPRTPANLLSSTYGETVFAREIRLFMDAGYTQWGNYLVPPF